MPLRRLSDRRSVSNGSFEKKENIPVQFRSTRASDVDRIMDMARTTINVLGDATGALFVSKLESDFDPERGERLAAAE